MNEKRRQAIPTLAAFLLLGIFAVSVLGALLAGAGVYSRLTRRDDRAYNSRTGLQYVASKVRQAPAPAAVQVTDFDGVDALTVTEQVDAEEYVTRVYCHDGWLMELFCAAQADFAPEDGERLLRAQSLELERRDGLLYVQLVQEEQCHELILHLETGEGAQP